MSCTQRPTHYPRARRSDEGDTLHGTFVPDPYRWMEDVDADETQRWVAAQNELTDSYFAALPGRDRIRERLLSLWRRNCFSAPEQRGRRLFYMRSLGLEEQSALWYQDGLEGEPTVLCDPNELDPAGRVSLAGYVLSRDGRFVAYGLARNGSDWQEWRVREVASGVDLEDHLIGLQSAWVAWTGDGRGFFYERHAPTASGTLSGEGRVYHHTLGSPQEEDELVPGQSEVRASGCYPVVTDDGQYLLIHTWKSTSLENVVYCRDLEDPEGELVALLPDFDAFYLLAGSVGKTLFFWTDLDAPLGRIVTIDEPWKRQAHCREVVPEAADVLETAALIGGRLVATYLHHASSRITTFTLDGRREHEVELPNLGTAYGLEGRGEDTHAFFCYSGFLSPACVLRLEVRTGTTSTFREQERDFDPAHFIIEQVFVTSPDGTRIPMFLCRHRDTARSPQTPCLLTGYGGFGCAETPFFSIKALMWMEQGGTFAQANLRGGGEYGKAWHQAGTKQRKQNVFDDFIAAAEWLISEGHTSSKRLAIQGASNGGLLVGACLTQRPELFGAALVEVGVLDMLRFHRFTSGWNWLSEYGSPEVEEEFQALAAYSPYHRIEPGTAYPPTLVSTADGDDRVFPAHSFKFAAALQHAQAGTAPILIRTAAKAGHGGGTPTAMLIDELVDNLGFLHSTVGANAMSSSARAHDEGDPAPQ